ncbi:MAG: hypothetical protein Q9172_001606 [Xanthocarpia lactea]
MLVPYTHGLRHLDNIYLDTTFAVNSDPYRSFPTKAQGLSELLREVNKFPNDTIFHFNAWTLGYEEVWMVLAAHLRSKIHVDAYKLRLYSSLQTSLASVSGFTEGAAFCGFQFGNRTQAGCLTTDDSVRLHSCERGTKCKTLDTSKKVVWITPLINRSDQGDIPELGAGGGGGDLTQTHELELNDPQAGLKLVELCRQQIQDGKEVPQTLRLVGNLLCSGKRMIRLDLLDASLKEDEIPLEILTRILIEATARKDRLQNQKDYFAQSLNQQYPGRGHSTFETDAEGAGHIENWTPETSIEGLFGHLCTGTSFSHDQEMRPTHEAGTVGHPQRSPWRSFCKRANSAAPKLSPLGPARYPGLLRDESASQQSEPANAEASDEDLGSPTTSNKRRAATNVSTQMTRRVKLELSCQERSELEDGDVIARSFSGWLAPPGDKSVSTKRTMSESTVEGNVNAAAKRERGLSLRTRRSDPEEGESDRSPSSRTHNFRSHSDPFDVGNERSMRNNDTSSLLSSRGTSIAYGSQSQGIGSGKQYNPVALPDTSGSEMDAEAGGRAQIRSSIDESYYCRSRSGTPLSLADSMFELKETGPSDPNTGRRTDPRRIQYRKEIYKAVKCDDGHIWGREYSLVSTAARHDQDDLEL